MLALRNSEFRGEGKKEVSGNTNHVLAMPCKEHEKCRALGYSLSGESGTGPA